MCRKLRHKLSIVSQRAKNRILIGCDGRPQDKTSNLSRPRAWVEINFSVTYTLMWPCPGRREGTMGCLWLEIEGQSCLVGSVDQGLMKKRKIDLLERMTPKKRHTTNIKVIHFPIATLPGIFQQTTPKNSMETFWPNYRPSIVIGLRVDTHLCKLRATSITRL